MTKDQKYILEAYKNVTEGMKVVPISDSEKPEDEDEQTVAPKTGVPELDDIISYVRSKNISDYSKQLIYGSLNNQLIKASFSSQANQKNQLGDVDTINYRPGAVSGPGAPSATGYSKPQNTGQGNVQNPGQFRLSL